MGITDEFEMSLNTTVWFNFKNVPGGRSSVPLGSW